MNTYRVYLRHSGQMESDKTTTTSYRIADAAFVELIRPHAGEPCAALMTCNNKNLQYVQLDDPQRRCGLCNYFGPALASGRCPICRWEIQ